MTDDVVDIRADEVAGLRRSLREARKRLAIARDNDVIVGALHKLALLLIEARGAGGKGQRSGLLSQAEKVLARGLPKIARCRIVAADAMDDATRRKVAKLPVGGAALLVADGYALRGLLSVYSIPLRRGARVYGLLLLYARGADAFPAGMASDFALRLAQLLTATMATTTAAK